MTYSAENNRVAAIHDSMFRGFFVISGGGSGLLERLLCVPGASRTVLEAEIPYSPASMRKFLGRMPERFCSEPTARQMAAMAWRRAVEDAKTPKQVFGFSLTCVLATERPHRGEHRAYLAWQTLEETRSYALLLDKTHSRQDEEAQVCDWAEQILGECCGVLPETTPWATRQVAEPGWQQVQSGAAPWVLQAPETLGEREILGIFPGSFAPFHAGHRKMRDVAVAMLGGEVALEIAVLNVDKPPLDYVEMAVRGEPLREYPVFWTGLPYFEQKAEHFSGKTFVVGTDTIRRIADVSYHHGEPVLLEKSLRRFADLACRFLVFGRWDGERFVSLSDLNLPPLLQERCVEVPESVFRNDVSSTRLREQSLGNAIP
ncbi:MAG: hypothetical protein Q4D98_02455 [Planctomycetia bacterium]|nr:hypothetical protein [Planctomycetia bacterium]